MVQHCEVVMGNVRERSGVDGSEEALCPVRISGAPNLGRRNRASHLEGKLSSI
jgi:hypothetical protein